MKNISLAVPEIYHKDTAQNRQSHSFEVANTIDILNHNISKRLGYNIDYLGLGRSIGLFHDIGHMAFSHIGERKTNKLLKEFTNNKIFYSSNSNNYKKLQKTNILIDLPMNLRFYFLASLAKHPNELYPEQKYIEEAIEEATKQDLSFLSAYDNFNKPTKTVQCQIMDISDEISYTISDVIDSRNIFKPDEVIDLFEKSLPTHIIKILKKTIKNKSLFRNELDKIFFNICDNYTINNNSIVTPISSEINSIKENLQKLTLNKILQHENILKIRKEEENIIETVVSYYLNNINNIDKLYSKYYTKKLIHSKTNNEKIIHIRDFLASLTDKGMKKEYERILNYPYL